MKSKLLTMLLLCLMAAPVWAAKPQSKAIDAVKLAEANAEAGKNAFNAKEYEKALQLYKAAYAVIKRPSLLFNIARCLEELKRYEEALGKYREYLELPEIKADPAAQADASAHMKKIDETLNPPPAPDVVEPLPKVVTATDDVPPQRTFESPSLALKASIIGTGALTALGIVTAVVASGKLAHSETTFASIKTMQDVDTYMSELDDFKTWRNARNGLFIGAGVGAAITGYLVWDQYLSPAAAKSRHAIIVLPNLNGGLMLSMKF